MKSDFIQLRRERSFGDVITVSFEFIKQEGPELLRLFLTQILPLIVVTVLLGAYFSFEIQDATFSGDPKAVFMSPFYYLSVLVSIFTYYYIQTMVITYMKLYAEKGKGNFRTEETFSYAVGKVFPVFLVSLLVTIMAGLGTILCIVPGIYLAVATSMITVSMVFEGASFDASFSRSFKLIKHEWWNTFLLFFVVGIMVYSIFLLLTIPLMLFGLKPWLWGAKDGLQEMIAMSRSPIYIIANSVVQMLQLVIIAFVYIVLVFQFNNLAEKKEPTELMSKIEELDSDEA